MSRAALLAAAVADQRQIARLDQAAMKDELARIAQQALGAAIADPSRLALGADGISPLERETMELAFEELVVGLWPEIVRAYHRGAGGEAGKLPEAKALRALGTADLVALLDGLRLSGVRETLHAQAWGFASTLARAARRAVALAGSGGAA